MAPKRWSYPVNHIISILNAVLGNQRANREEYFNMGAVAKQQKEFKLGGYVLRFQGLSQFYAKGWEGMVEWENISNLLSDDRLKQCYKTIKIPQLCTPSGVCRQFCALKCVAWVCLSYFSLQCDNFDLFCITILVCFLFLFQSPSSISSDLFFPHCDTYRLVFKLLLKHILA